MILRSAAEYMDKKATGKNIRAHLVCVLLFNIGVIPLVQSRLQHLSGGNGPLDLLFSYDPEQAYRILESYSDPGRTLYALFAVTGDVFYPICYSTLLSLIIARMFRHSARPRSMIAAMVLIPFGALLFDLTENALLVTMVQNFPMRFHTVAASASFCTSMKWLCIGCSALFLLAGAAGMLSRKVTRS